VLAGKTLAATPQAADGVVYAHKLDKAESALDFARPAIELERQVRAFDPWPGSDAEIAGERVRVWGATALDQRHAAAPGTLLAVHRDGLDLACADGVLRVTAIQRAGGRRISAADYLNARPELREARP
jgi:methionyl-tRNA formyltransferase